MKVKRVRLNDHDWHHLSDSDEAKWGYNEAIVWLGLVIVSIIVVGLKPARLGGLVLHGDCYINRRIWQIPYTKEYTNTMSFKFSQLSALLHLLIVNPELYTILASNRDHLSLKEDWDWVTWRWRIPVALTSVSLSSFIFKHIYYFELQTESYTLLRLYKKLAV